MFKKYFSCVCVALSFVIAAPTGYAAKAMLPHASSVPAGARLPIDGMYRISGINKRVRVEGGRAVVVDPWKHLFIWDVEPGMVVIQDIQQQSGSTFSGRDLPLQGAWRATFDKHKFELDVVVDGAFGATKYKMTRVADDGSGYEDPPPAPEVEPEPESDVNEAPRMLVSAVRVAKARKLGCKGKQNYFSTIGGGTCWTCPSGYKRTHRSMDSNKACKKRKSLGGPWTEAKYKGRAWGCPTGQFHATKWGDGSYCYKCPAGYTRISKLGVDTKACRMQI